MATQIYVNLPVKDLERSKRFFAHLGYAFDPQYTDDKAACMVVSDVIHVMLLVEPFFQGFTDKPVADAHRSTEVLLCLSCASRAELDALVAKAAEAGGRVPRQPVDHGFMVQHGFEDPDGHVWELVHMVAAPAADPTPG